MTTAPAREPRPPATAAVPSGFPIALKSAKLMTLQQELALARRAYAAAPASDAASGRLAALLLRSEAFQEAAALLEASGLRRFGHANTLMQALLSLETPDANARVGIAAGRALALAADDTDRAIAFAARGKAELRLGRACGADTLAAALRCDPHNQNACKRLVSYYLDGGAPRKVLDLIDGLAARGAGHTRLLAARTLALARLGDVAAAQASVGMDTFLCRTALDPPGWPDIAAFNAALAGQLLAHPALRYGGYGIASEQSWRIDVPLSRAAPLVAVALERIRGAITAYLADVSRHDHPWLRARPAAGTLHSQCVITDRAGYEAWHVHESGWLSGVYYVQVPDAVRHGSDTGGCIVWGVPEDVVGDTAAAAYGEHCIRPEPGMLTLFPSHAYHRTFPHGADAKRIVLAFDVRPEELG